jgi:hypothetical protein
VRIRSGVAAAAMALLIGGAPVLGAGAAGAAGSVPTGVITTIAGNGTAGPTGDGGPATAAGIQAAGVAYDRAGNLYEADGTHQLVRKVSPAGIITAFAGTGATGATGDGGPATAATLSSPSDVAVDGSGNVYIADFGNSRVRMVNPAGVITTFAGTTAGFSGDGGPATAAKLNFPYGVAVDGAGRLLISEYAGVRVRRVAVNGTISTVAGTGVAAFSGDGGQATAAQIDRPEGVGVDGNQNILISDFGNNRVRRIDASTGVITTIAGNGSTVGTGDGGPAAAAGLGFPGELTVDNADNVFVVSYIDKTIRRIGANGIISTVAGTGIAGFSGDNGPAVKAQLANPQGLAVSPASDLVIGDGATIRAISGIASQGYLMAASDGGVFTHGSSIFYGSEGALKLAKPIVTMAATPTKQGYWLFAADGGVFTHGDAKFYGSEGALKLAQPIVAAAATPSGNGYWLFASDGGVFSHGDAAFYGSEGALKLVKPIVAAAATPSGHGYWLFASDGGVFSHGDAAFYGSEGALKLAKPIVASASTPTGKGYWLFASDGGVFTHGDAAFYGSEGALKLVQPVVAGTSN